MPELGTTVGAQATITAAPIKANTIKPICRFFIVVSL